MTVSSISGYKEKYSILEKRRDRNHNMGDIGLYTIKNI